MTPQPDDATAIYAGASLSLDLELAFAAANGRPAVEGDEVIRGSTQWRRVADGRWTQDPIARIDFTKGRRH